MEDADEEPRRRLDQFVDAAFAFALTLLLIAGAPPETLADLQTALLRIPASATAFVLIVVFWIAHRAFGKLTSRRDPATVLFSLAIVFTVLVYVFPMRLLMQSLFFWLSGGRLPGEGLIRSLGDLMWLYQAYGIGFAVLSGLYAALFARAAKLAESPGARDHAVASRDAWAICSASGLLSSAVALFPMASAPWLPPTVYWLIPFAVWVRGSSRRRVAARAPKAARPRKGQPQPGL